LSRKKGRGLAAGNMGAIEAAMVGDVLRDLMACGGGARGLQIR
jgi:hypothetical protein